MPNYQYVIDSSFKPYSFQEMLVPFALYKDAWEKNEENYDNLMDKLGRYSNLPNGTAKDIYDKYYNDLHNYGKDFSQHGLSIDNQAGLMDMKRRYSGEIGRLDRAELVKQEAVKSQQAISAQDPTRMFSVDASTLPLDYYLDKDSVPYKSYSGAMLSQQVSQAAGALAKSLEEAVNSDKPLDQYTSAWIDRHGFTPGQVYTAITHPDSAEASPVLNALVDNVINMSGIPSWNDPASLKQAYQYARYGLWNAVGESKITPYDNFGSRLNAQTEASKELEAFKTQQAKELYQYQINHPSGGTDSNGDGVLDNIDDLGIDPEPIYSQVEKKESDKKIDDYSQYFYTKNGRTYLNRAGIIKYREGLYNIKHPMEVPDTARGQINYIYGDHKFYDFINSIGGGKYIDSMKLQPGNIGNLWNRYVNRSNHHRYSADERTEYNYKISEDDNEKALRSIGAAASGTKLKEVEFDPKKKTFVETGKTLDSSALLASGKDAAKWKILAVQISPWGTTFKASGTDGEIHRFRLPDGVNSRAQNAINASMKKAATYQDWIKNGYHLNAKKQKVKNSEADKIQLYKKYKAEVNKAELFESQLFYTNTTEDQEFKPYGDYE